MWRNRHGYNARFKTYSLFGDVEGIGNEVVVGGYVQKVRDLGNLIFIDLRDRTGIVQLAF